MLFLTMRIGADQYAIPATDVVEVLPLVHLKSLPNSPAGIVGMFDHRGSPAPVVDLTLLATGKPSRKFMTTRMALVNYVPAGGESHLLAVIAEEMTDTFHAAAEEFVETGVDAPGAAYLGPVIKRGDRIVQRVNVAQLLSPEVRESLFRSVMS